ncbi:hypothetical protein WN55_01026 [Dufourea novaeangliae]|uniref:Uncharacterized protein n=1 Tax=Dufourea novaeangliae TaxID=178035 RepID=A0A154PDK7_DUFNO|nr:hypothetical protein WN55_01026 [Dufourea novaeangliae]
MNIFEYKSSQLLHDSQKSSKTSGTPVAATTYDEPSTTSSNRRSNKIVANWKFVTSKILRDDRNHRETLSSKNQPEYSAEVFERIRINRRYLGYSVSRDRKSRSPRRSKFEIRAHTWNRYTR